MRVRCCLSFLRNRSKLQVGDTGVVVHLDHNGHLHDRNVEVASGGFVELFSVEVIFNRKTTFIQGQMESLLTQQEVQSPIYSD
jgi:hypothetical protein